MAISLHILPTRAIEGVTESVAAAMVAVDANVLREDGLLQRTCEHGIRHPVGHLHRSNADDDEQGHQRVGKMGDVLTVDCCGCCATYSGRAKTAHDQSVGTPAATHVPALTLAE